ncbi:hypothetical protein RND81_10G084100 [Saponaria officinalis]|uniref:No apical meristem-associated C-terminal domain-containing protein n=1 Tax=Saponaria officinalis TaxID=3572 RepID=A0AAW1HZM9_SAPOF
MLTNRWGRIAAGVSKWVGHYEEAKRRHTSGMNDHDIMVEACVLHGSGTNFENQWHLLKKYPRWSEVLKKDENEHPPTPSTPSDGSGKRGRVNEDENFTPTDDGGSTTRPMGVKVQKRNKGKSKVDDTEISNLVSKFDQNNEIMLKRYQQAEQTTLLKQQFLQQEAMELELDRARIDLEWQRYAAEQMRIDEEAANNKWMRKMKMYESLNQRSTLNPAEEEAKAKLFIELYDFYVYK